jgi:hypothetical protein
MLKGAFTLFINFSDYLSKKKKSMTKGIAYMCVDVMGI